MSPARLVSRHAQRTIAKRHPRERQAPDPWSLYRFLRYGSFKKRKEARRGR